jgi:hypothetical protein
LTSRWVVAAVAGLILVIIGAGAAISGGTGTGTPIERPIAVAVVTPGGWVPVDFGDAQLSVPAAWRVAYDAPCPQVASPGVIYVGFAPVPRHQACAQRDSTDHPTIVEMWPVAVGGAGFNPARINGIDVLKAVNGQEIVVRVPSLGVELNAYGPFAQKVIDTLTYSPAAEALTSGPVPLTPSSSRPIALGSIQLTVPRLWPIANTNIDGQGCPPEISLTHPNTALVDSDTISGAGLKCLGLAPSQRPFTPGDGVIVDLHPTTDPSWPPDSALADCYTQQGLELCPYRRGLQPGQDQNAEIDILFVKVTVPGKDQRYNVEIGLAGDGTVARTILASMRAA